jgi:hypothetical protein
MIPNSEGNNLPDLYVSTNENNTLIFPTDDSLSKADAINTLIGENEFDKNLISDGYHTFGDLYDHRVALWITVCRLLAHTPSYQQNYPVWRSKLHSDGSSSEGWYMLGLHREEGKQVSYNLPMSTWKDTWFADTLHKAPTFDGHTAADVLARLNEVI